MSKRNESCESDKQAAGLDEVDEEAVAAIIDVIKNKDWTLRADALLILKSLKELGYKREKS